MKKFARIMMEMFSYFLIMLVLLLIVKMVGWSDMNAVSYAAAVTIGWAVGKAIVPAIEKKRVKKRRAAESANIPGSVDDKK